MHSLRRAGRACQRALAAVLRLILRAVRFVFILGLVVVPVPVTLFLAGLITSSGRRNLPAEVLRKR